MRKLIWAFVIVLTLGFVFTACTKDRRDEAKTPASKTKMTNADLENNIKAKIDSDAQLKAANLEVNANADKNEVTLTGKVESETLRTKAVDLAKSAHAGLIVNDKIDVRPAG
jgi:osmotically-inducible protein OsmY